MSNHDELELQMKIFTDKAKEIIIAVQKVQGMHYNFQNFGDWQDVIATACREVGP